MPTFGSPPKLTTKKSKNARNSKLRLIRQILKSQTYADPEMQISHFSFKLQNLKREVRSTLDSLISGNKAKQLQTTKDSESAKPIPISRTSLNSTSPSSFQPLNREITTTGVSIQPKGTYQLNSKKSLGSYSDKNDSKVSASTSSYSYSMSSSSASSSFRY